MKIMKFRASDSTQALRLIRDELGDDAAILTSYSVPDGVEYVVTADALETPARTVTSSRSGASGAAMSSPGAAMSVPGTATRFYDWQSDTPQIKPVAYTSEHPLLGSGRTTAALDSIAALTQRLPTASTRQEIDSSARGQAHTSTQAPSQTADMLALKEELGSMRNLLEKHLKQFAWQEQPRRERVAEPALVYLQAFAMPFEQARPLLATLPAGLDDVQLQSHLRQQLAQKLPVLAQPLQGLVALLGASAAGKTTTLVKLAARHVLRHGADSLVIISTDASRVGAMDQVRAYGRILRVPVLAACTPDELRNCLYLNRDKALILIDTPAISHRDRVGQQRLAQLLAVAPGMTQLLTLASDSESHAASELLQVCSQFSLSAVVLTRLDLAARLGGLLSLLMATQTPVAWCCNGARVPHDLKPADAADLVELAWQLAAAEQPAPATMPLPMNTATTHYAVGA